MDGETCEHFKKDYSKAARVGYAAGDVSGIYWEWICDECGQIYREKCKEPITIN